MSHCCGNHSKAEKINKFSFGEQPPKSFIGKFFFNIGKKEYEKENHKKMHGKKCC